VTAPPTLVDRQPLIDEVLQAFAPALGTGGPAYRGHVYRVYNLARCLLGSARRDDELAVASAFHDLGIWSDGTFDYLGPSLLRANDYVRERRPGVSADLVAALIGNHHLLFRVRHGAEPETVEAFRRADLVDVSGAWYRAGLDRGFLRELGSVFPYLGFHGVLARAAGAWFVRHPLRPLPMVRFSAARAAPALDGR
jgi:hypothetical protein